MFLEAVTLPVMVRTRVERKPNAIFYIPEIFGHWNPYVEREMNWHMYEKIRQLAQRQEVEQGVGQFSEMIGSYELKTNERNVLSVSFSNYAYVDGFAHGLTLMDSLTFDVLTGLSYSLSDLFIENANRTELLSQIVNEQVKEREMPVFEEPVMVADDQPFYIADQTLVLYYPLYAITPYYYGIPIFPIPVYKLQSIIKENGPLGRMLAYMGEEKGREGDGS